MKYSFCTCELKILLSHPFSHCWEDEEYVNHVPRVDAKKSTSVYTIVCRVKKKWLMVRNKCVCECPFFGWDGETIKISLENLGRLIGENFDFNFLKLYFNFCILESWWARAFSICLCPNDRLNVHLCLKIALNSIDVIRHKLSRISCSTHAHCFSKPTQKGKLCGNRLSTC